MGELNGRVSQNNQCDGHCVVLAGGILMDNIERI